MVFFKCGGVKKSRHSIVVGNILEEWMTLHLNSQILGPKSAFLGVEDGSLDSNIRTW